MNVYEKLRADIEMLKKAQESMADIEPDARRMMMMAIADQLARVPVDEPVSAD